MMNPSIKRTIYLRFLCQNIFENGGWPKIYTILFYQLCNVNSKLKLCVAFKVVHK